jgi:hypothetical protein
MFLRNISPPFSGSKNEIHGVVFQKIMLFITTAVRTSDPVFA